MSEVLLSVSTNHYLVLGFLLFAIGLVGIASRRNLITVLMSLELVLNGVNLNLVAFADRLSDLTGQVFAVFTITVAAGEAAVGLGILLTVYRLFGSTELHRPTELEG
jgi:NADH-quinone oxidoreductase subunit K